MEKEKNAQFFGRLVKQERLALGLTQEQLADKIGADLKSVQNWEAGNIAGPQNLRRLSETFGVSIKQLVGAEQANQINRLNETGSMYRVNEEFAGPSDHPTREQCREYFERFLATCDSCTRVGWLWCELQEKFPLNKFKRKDEG